MAPFDPAAYGPAVAALLNRPRLPDLGFGPPDESVRPALEALDLSRAADGRMPSACRAGLWLLFDFFEESHGISQDLPDGAGAFWHGILHRREGDFGNAKYWFRRVGDHPVFPDLARAAADLPDAPPGLPARWDAAAFVDQVEACVRGRSPHADWARRVQQREWQLLFDWCWRTADGG
jgi:hypothetical protein